MTSQIDALRVEFDPALQGVMAVILAVMMFTVALNLRVADFSALRKQPVRILGGVAAQLLGLPLLTLLLIILVSPPASVALGMFVVASCPGGNISNLLTHAARGDTAYSVSLTAISSTTAAIATPVSIFVWSSLYAPTRTLIEQIEVGPLPFITQTIALLAIPLALGMITAARFPGAAEAMRRVLQPAALACIAGMVVVGLWTNWTVVLVAGAIVIPLGILHNALAFGLGGATGFALGLPSAGRRSLMFEVGIQNAGLGLLILLSQFEGLGGAAAMTAWWSVWHLIAGSSLAGWYRLLDWRGQAGGPGPDQGKGQG